VTAVSAGRPDPNPEGSRRGEGDAAEAATGSSALPVVAIDGPSGSGKSTLARALAARLHLAHLDTGAMYRAIAWAALQRGLDPSDGPGLGSLARALRLEVGERVVADEEDVTEAIRRPEVDAVVSAVAAHPEVRRELVRRQREWIVAHRGAVAEGRDIGTVVWPEATCKVFLVADEAERARRRASERLGAGVGAAAGVGADGRSAGAEGATIAAEVLDAVRAGLGARDEQDRRRAVGPLVAAPDAHVLDTTRASVEDLVETVVRWL